MSSELRARATRELQSAKDNENLIRKAMASSWKLAQEGLSGGGQTEENCEVGSNHQGRRSEIKARSQDSEEANSTKVSYLYRTRIASLFVRLYRLSFLW
jgi:hypothetical protein